jgi:hypothetical protein
MIAQASGLGMHIGIFSRLLRGVGVIAMLDAGLDTMPHFEVPPGAGVLWLLVPSMAVGVYIDCGWVADKVEVLHSVISAIRE